MQIREEDVKLNFIEFIRFLDMAIVSYLDIKMSISTKYLIMMMARLNCLTVNVIFLSLVHNKT